MKYLKKIFKPSDNNSKDLEYKLQAHGGETIESYVDRLFKHFREVQNNKLAAYAQFVSNKRSTVVGEFNGVIVRVNEKSTKTEIINEIKSKLKIRSQQTQTSKVKKGFGKFNESNQINWTNIESKWNDWYEESNGESDYDDEYDAMKSFVKNVEVDWKKVKREYFNYIEETNNEDDYDDKFEKFKSIVNKNFFK